MKIERHLPLILEMVLNLLIFAICAVVCVALLLHAHGISRGSAALTDAVYLAQDAAEVLRAGGTPEPSTGDYQIEITPLGGKDASRIAVLRDGEPIFTLEEVAHP